MANIEKLHDELNALLDQRDDNHQTDKRLDFKIDELTRRIKQAEKSREYSTNVNDYFWVLQWYNSENIFVDFYVEVPFFDILEARQQTLTG